MTRRRRLRIWLGLGERCGDKKQPDKRFEKMGKVFIFKEISSIKYGRQKNERDWPQLRSKSSTWRRWTGPASPQSTSSSPPGPGRAPGRWCRPPGASPATSSGPTSWPPAHKMSPRYTGHCPARLVTDLPAGYHHIWKEDLFPYKAGECLYGDHNWTGTEHNTESVFWF